MAGLLREDSDGLLRGKERGIASLDPERVREQGRGMVKKYYSRSLFLWSRDTNRDEALANHQALEPPPAKDRKCHHMLKNEPEADLGRKTGP